MLAFRHTEDGLHYIDFGDYVRIETPKRIYESWVHHQWQNRVLKRWFYYLGQRIDIK